jgi:hypothetical protein
LFTEKFGAGGRPASFTGCLEFITNVFTYNNDADSIKRLKRRRHGPRRDGDYRQNEGRRVKAEATRGGKFRGFTDENTGRLNFELQYDGAYGVAAKRMFDSASGEIKAGAEALLRLR